MRSVLLICSLLLGGCAQPEAAKPNVIVKTVYIAKSMSCAPVELVKAHCKAIGTEAACDDEQRCQWVRRDSKPHCRVIYCKPFGKPFPR